MMGHGAGERCETRNTNPSYKSFLIPVSQSMSNDEDSRNDVLDPFLNLSLPSPALSLCFVGSKNGGGKFWNHGNLEEDGDDQAGDGDSDSSSDELVFRSSALQNRAEAPSRTRDHRRRQDLLRNRMVVSCHKNGEALLWDCARQTRISTIVRKGDQGSGMAVKRIDTGYDNDCQFIYQTRDSKGTVSIHCLGNGGDPSAVVRDYETYSATFCHAAPCRGNSHLIALPSRQETTATVMDDRDRVPVFVTTATRLKSSIGNSNTTPIKQHHHHGMVTSLAMSMTGSGGRPILACGMESGSVIFYDFASGRSSVKGDCNLSKDPVLALDLAPSESQSITTRITCSLNNAAKSSIPSSSSVLAVAGLAGDILEVAELPEVERGRVALLKATVTAIEDASSTGDANRKNDDSRCWKVRTRARLSTCRVADEDATTTPSFGKPGVAICRFRPDDGRIFAVGGWDHRVRLFERSKGSPVGILRGHIGSVNALDWAADASTSGLLATAGAEDGQMSFWECFPQKQSA